MKCLPVQWFSCSSHWVSSLEIKAIHDLVQRYCQCCWPEGARSFLRPLYNCVLEYKWVYSPKQIFHLNSFQLNFFYKLHHPVFLQCVHKLNSILWLCKVAPVWDSDTWFCPWFISCSLWGWRTDGAKWAQPKTCVTCTTLLWYWNCKSRVPDLHSCESNQNKIGSKLQVNALSDHPEALWWSSTEITLSGGGNCY